MDATHHGVWRAHFGKTTASGSGLTAKRVVPEPTAIVLLMLTAAGWLLRRDLPVKVPSTRQRVGIEPFEALSGKVTWSDKRASLAKL